MAPAAGGQDPSAGDHGYQPRLDRTDAQLPLRAVDLLADVADLRLRADRLPTQPKNFTRADAAMIRRDFGKKAGMFDIAFVLCIGNQ
jgi:hypothetical protein